MPRKPTLRGGISDLVNDLQIIALDIDDPAVHKQIDDKVDLLMTMWREVIFEQLDHSEKSYLDAIDALNESKKAAVEAKKDLAKTVEAIESATKAIKALDKVLGFTAKILAG